ncbi:MAG: copper-binding protein [Sandaracinaceae bacterium]|nr:copper-binding protein [Sandaracinaceae bacterium]
MLRRTFLAASLTSVGALVACGGAEAQPSGRTWNATGVITEIRRERSSITIHHDPIEGLMPEMTMPFDVQDASLFEGLSVGDRVAFTVSREAGGRYVIRSIRRR